MKLCYGVPRNTFTYLVEGWFASEMVSMRNQVMTRYAGFYRKLLSSPRREIRALARIVADDPRSNNCSNLRLLISKTGFCQPYMYSSLRVFTRLPLHPHYLGALHMGAA